jgi:hypothetical protein
MAKMTFEGLVNALSVIPPNRPVGIYGYHGCGKTQSLYQIGEKLGYKQIRVIDMGSIGDICDLTGNFINRTREKKRVKLVNGQPVQIMDKTTGLWTGKYETETYESSYTDTAEPYWWPEDETEPAFIIVDEANRIANRSVQNGMMRLVCEGICGSRRIHPESRIVSSFNPIGKDLYHVQEWDMAYKSRWITYDYEPSVDEWLEIGRKRGFHPEVMRYIVNHPAELQPWANDEEMMAIEENAQTKNARSWEKVSEIMCNPNWAKLYGTGSISKFRTILQGVIGSKGAEGFTTYLRNQNRIDIKAMLKNWETDYKAKVEAMTNFEQAMLVRDVVEYLKSISDSEKALKDGEKSLIQFFKGVREENSTVGYHMILRSVGTWGQVLYRTIPKLLSIRAQTARI